METTKIIEIIKEYGFTVTEVECQGYVVSYRDLNMYLLSTENDPGFIRISLPMLWQKYSASQMPVILDMLNLLNSRNQTTKSFLKDEQVWCWFESRVTDEELIGRTVELGLMSLLGTYEEFLQMLNGEFDPDYEDIDYLEEDVYGCILENEEFESFLLGDYDDYFAKNKPQTKEEEKYPF